MAVLTPRNEGEARGSEQCAAFTFWVRGPGDPSYSTQSFCLLLKEAAPEGLQKTDSLLGATARLDYQTVPPRGSSGALSLEAAAAVVNGAWRPRGRSSATATVVTIGQTRAGTGRLAFGTRVNGAR